MAKKTSHSIIYNNKEGQRPKQKQRLSQASRFKRSCNNTRNTMHYFPIVIFFGLTYEITIVNKTKSRAIIYKNNGVKDILMFQYYVVRGFPRSVI